jgi:hypothetical protein
LTWASGISFALSAPASPPASEEPLAIATYTGMGRPFSSASVSWTGLGSPDEL